MIKTLGLGLGFAALPSFVTAEMTEIPIDALDHGERIIPVEEKDTLSSEDLVEVTFDELVKYPVETLDKIYSALSLPHDSKTVELEERWIEQKS